MKILIKDLIYQLENLAPIEYAEPYDNVGLIIGSYNQIVTNILITLDLTENVLIESIKKNCNFIITFHPIIFKPKKSLIIENIYDKIIIHALKNDISIYVIHTNLDSIWEGTNSYISKILKINKEKVLIPKKNILKKLYTYVPLDYAKKLRNSLFDAGAGNISDYSHCSYNINGIGSYMGNEKTKPFRGSKKKFHMEEETCISVIFPYYKWNKIKKALFKNHPYEEIAYEVHNIENINFRVGIGIIGILEKEMNEYDFLFFLKKKMNLLFIRHSQLRKKNIKKVSIITGSGSFGIIPAMKEGSDVFISSDIKYHDFFKSNQEMLIVDIGHYESEKFVKKMLKTFLEKKFPSIFAYESKIDTNPVKYFS
ncbi:Nif3-like dinuclear metal center hexameric protein [Blattabacterium cuenoti]|uniref:Nif3-like dinuclear metal center hexameric protein n=1 Tax=Blattabacterium cuenoti TaxID=1653831 RepID=UPI00163C67AB|nr:Nif3-like dinuclear metal center hexameric protein [Blattabacterium cuenoti]